MSFRGEKRLSVSQEIPVLCKFWQEDGVWNGSAQDLPVAVFGETIEEAKKNLGEALICHFHALHEIGKIEKVTSDLCRLASERLSFDEMSNNELFWKTTISGEVCEVVA